MPTPLLPVALLACAVLAGVTGFNRDEVLEINRARYEALNSYSFKVRYETKAYTNPLPPFINGMEKIAWGEEEYGAQGDKRYWKRMFGTSATQEPTSITHEAWNGSVYRQLYPADGTGIHDNVMTARHGFMEGRFGIRTTPLECALLPDKEDGARYINGNLVKILEGGKAEELGYETIDGATCLVLGVKGKPILWLDQDHGYAVRRYKQVLMNEGISEKVLDNQEFTEIKPGFWLPTRSRVAWFGIAEVEGSGPGPLLFEETNVFSNIEVDKGIPDSSFELVFPAGTRVRDDVARTMYEVGKSGPEGFLKQNLSSVIADIAREEKRGNAPQEGAPPVAANETATSASLLSVPPPGPGRRLWVAMISLVLVSLGLLWLIVVQLRKARAKGEKNV